MEAIGLQVKPAALDPMGALQQGLNLGQMGLNIEQIRQQLRTAAIAEQEAARALSMRKFEDTARTSLAPILAKHTGKDAAGKPTVNYRAAIIEARQANLDPTYLTELEGKLYGNETANLKNTTEKVGYIKKSLDEMAPQMRYMDEAAAAKYVEQRAKLLSRATTIPVEEIGNIVSQHFGLGTGGKLVTSANMFSDASIQPETERQFAGQGLSREDISPQGATSVAARNFLKGRGINVPANMNLAQMRQHPEFGTLIRTNEAAIMGTIPSEGTRVAGIEKAAEAQAGRVVYTNAENAARDIKKELGTRIGSFTQTKWAELVAQDPRYAAINDAIADYNERNKTDISIARDGLEPVLTRLRRQNEKLGTQQASGAAIANTNNLRNLGTNKAPEVTDFVTMKAPNGEPVRVPRSRIAEAKAKGLKE
jgi:hypothetical protein